MAALLSRFKNAPATRGSSLRAELYGRIASPPAAPEADTLCSPRYESRVTGYDRRGN